MFFRSSYLGMDFRADCIKFAHLARSRNKVTIKGFYQFENPLGTTVFKTQREQFAIQQTLSKIKQKLPCNRVVMGIPSNYAAFRYVNFPLINKKELNEAIFWEMKEFDAIFDDEYISDYEILEKQTNICRVFLTAVPKDLIMTYTKILTEAGFCLKALDVYPLANARLLKEQKTPGVSVIVDLDATHSEVTIVENGILVLNRNLDFPRSISFGSFLQELLRILNFYSFQNKKSTIDRIILLGENIELKDTFRSNFNIDTILGRELECDFIIQNHQNIKNPMDFFCAMGFSLRG